MNLIMCLFIICGVGQSPKDCETAYVKPNGELSSRFINVTPVAPSYVLCGPDEWVKKQDLYKEVYFKK